MLGDDIVIADDSVASEYRSLLSDLEVPISEAKTHSSKDVYEFAKRWFFKGIEVSPFPLHGLIENSKRYYLLLEFIREQEERGHVMQPSPFANPVRISELFALTGARGRLLGQLLWKFKVAATIPLTGKDPEEVYAKAKAFAQLSGVSLSCNLRLATVVRFFEQLAALTFN